MQKDKISAIVHNHPRECLYLLLSITLLIWQSVAAIVGIIAYVIVRKKYSPWLFLCIGLLLLGSDIYFLYQGQIFIFIKLSFYHNKLFIHELFVKQYLVAFREFNQHLLDNTLSLAILVIGIFKVIALIPDSAHRTTIQGLQQGVLPSAEKELADDEIHTLLEKVTDTDDGILLGISKYTGEKVVIPDKHINQVALVLGTTGSGKTITLRRFYQRAITQGYPLIIVDGKPDDANIQWLIDLAKKNKRAFYGFNCGNYKAYDPLADGGYTELKDKIISLKDEWANDYYRSIAEDYLQTTFAILLKSNEKLDLKKVVSCLNYDVLMALSRQVKDSELHARVEALNHYNRQDITGLQAHLNILVHSELGQFFQNDVSAIKLSEVISNNGIVYFALPALRFPSFSKVLGKLVINDLKAIVDCYDNQHTKIFTIFDEFSVFAGEQVLNLVNMGRGKGVHAIFGTQGLADLAKIDKTFKDQLLNCTNTLICHRLNDQNSAEDVANWIGTKDIFNITAQLNLNDKDDKMGSIKTSKEFIIHPNAIKQQLRTGEAFYVTKCDGLGWEKVRVIIRSFVQ